MSSHVFRIATQEPDKLLEAVTASLGANSRIAKQVAEQMPKPKPQEPTGDCVVVVTDQWPPFHRLNEEFWTNEDDYQFDTWGDLAEYFPRAEFVIYRPEGHERPIDFDVVAVFKADALREAAQVQRQYAADARTQYGEAEHTNIADWLDEHANTIDPRRLEGARP